MGEPTQLIPQITTQSKNWIVRITVTESIPIMICSTGSRLKCYVFTDREGNEVTTTIYGHDVAVLEPMIHHYGVYDISNADVKITDPKYQIVNNPFQWNIRRQTPICPVPEARPNLRYFLDSLRPFSLIPEAKKAESKTIDIMGIIIHAFESKQINYGQDNVQHFTFVDIEKIPICVSLWNEMITSESQTLLEAARNHSVVVAKRLAIKSYDILSLASKNSTSFTIDPPIEAVANLKCWFHIL
ncbi:hypothetical protein LIER_09538 [Lithospermum erythrorhizon]|uniref:Replication protein A OB domain-containing protein n=1 Tax=Lithospermum erythrorhizon TaxID=34254 RepID=A0AAV3PH75_LITER